MLNVECSPASTLLPVGVNHPTVLFMFVALQIPVGLNVYSEQRLGVSLAYMTPDSKKLMRLTPMLTERGRVRGIGATR